MTGLRPTDRVFVNGGVFRDGKRIGDVVELSFTSLAGLRPVPEGDYDEAIASGVTVLGRELPSLAVDWDPARL